MKKTFLAALLAATVLPALAADYYIVVPVKKNEEALNKNISVVLNAVTLPGGLAGQAYLGFDFGPALRITGDPKLNMRGVTWSVVGGALPAGLALAADGKLTGVPAVVGIATFQLQASYKTKSGSQAYQLVVGEITVVLAAATLPEGRQGTAYYFDLGPTLSVNGDPDYTPSAVRWLALSGLPAGLQLTGAGVLTGTPAASGPTTIQVQAAYRGQVASRAFAISVKAPAPLLRLVDGQAASHDFGTRALGSDGAARIIAVTNAGNGVGSLAMSAFNGAHPTDFSASSTCTNVAPAVTCEVQISFRPGAAGTRTASLNIAGTAFTVSGVGQAAPRQYVVLTSGTTYQIPYGVNTITASVVGGGGGGAGSIATLGVPGGGGGAGGVGQASFTVSPGGTLSYTLGAGGRGGTGSSAGVAGGQSTLNYQAIALTALGGTGGNAGAVNSAAPGGTATGGTAYPGGQGYPAASFQGGGAGGGIGGAVGGAQGAGTPYAYAGGHGATAVYPGVLGQALAGAGVAVGSRGIGAPFDSNYDVMHGGNAVGYGHGGGGASVYGGRGGNGALGGGGGGGTGYNLPQAGGAGGAGFIVLTLN